jgi:hypothetical protein
MNYTEQLFSRWCSEDGLTPLHITADFDQIGEPVRLWWFFLEDKLISSREGLCDEEVIMFFGARHELTLADRLLIDSQQRVLSNL